MRKTVNFIIQKCSPYAAAALTATSVSAVQTFAAVDSWPLTSAYVYGHKDAGGVQWRKKTAGKRSTEMPNSEISAELFPEEKMRIPPNMTAEEFKAFKAKRDRAIKQEKKRRRRLRKAKIKKMLADAEKQIALEVQEVREKQEALKQKEDEKDQAAMAPYLNVKKAYDKYAQNVAGGSPMDNTANHGGLSVRTVVSSLNGGAMASITGSYPVRSLGAQPMLDIGIVNELPPHYGLAECQEAARAVDAMLTKNGAMVPFEKYGCVKNAQGQIDVPPDNGRYVDGLYDAGCPAPFRLDGLDVEDEAELDRQWVVDDWLGDGYILLEFLHRDLQAAGRPLANVTPEQMNNLEKAFLRGIRARQRNLALQGAMESAVLADPRLLHDNLLQAALG